MLGNEKELQLLIALETINLDAGDKVRSVSVRECEWVGGGWSGSPGGGSEV